MHRTLTFGSALMLTASVSTMDRTSAWTALVQLSVKPQTYLGAAAFLVLLCPIKLLLSRRKRLDLPVIKASPTDYKTALVEATVKVM